MTHPRRAWVPWQDHGPRRVPPGALFLGHGFVPLVSCTFGYAP